MNHVFLVGKVAAKPEVRSAQNMTKFVTLKIDVVEKKRDGTLDATVIPVEVYREMAEKAASLAVGAQVICEGKLKMRAWQYQGKSGASLQFVCWNLVAPSVQPNKPSTPEADLAPDMGPDIPF